ncbi:hypothetical protein P4O66_021973 [Electrophorus voltai]|uniref:Zinc finger protein SNAI2 n=1 Tax=Electrophorus voltai TaxID=2609070 RepID=A0AAD8ZRQ1_9TELE|nr:zinc finger protein SNAI3 isoform X2 [Electrophorus electricus]KAK1802310.1 hypothetical protein P4O66_021973 [Electrophorus voltai]
MPRSFLVKKHLSHKKPNYGILDSKKHDDQTQVTNVQSYWSRPGHQCPEECLLQPYPCPMSPTTCSTSHTSPADPVIHPQPSPDPSLPSDGPAPGNTYPLPPSRCLIRDPQPALTLLETAGTQRSEHGHNRRHVANSGLSRVAESLVGLAPANNSSQGRFECFDCHKAYFTFSGLAKHRQLQCEWHCQKYFSCKYCEKEYVSLGALKMHIRTHTLPCVCKLCGKAFSRPWLLQGHIRTHTGEKPFSCPHCSRAFADRSNLRAHLQTHSDVKKYQCRSCSKTFSRISLLSKHEEAGCCPMA